MDLEKSSETNFVPTENLIGKEVKIELYDSFSNRFSIHEGVIYKKQGNSKFTEMSPYQLLEKNKEGTIKGIHIENKLELLDEENRIFKSEALFTRIYHNNIDPLDPGNKKYNERKEFLDKYRDKD